MKTNEDIEGYLIEFGKPYETVEEGLWVIDDAEDNIQLLVWHSHPTIEFKVQLFRAPAERRGELFETLLRLNASTDLLAGAYGLEDEMVVITDTLQSENLDYNEFRSSVESLSLEITDRYPELRGYRDASSTQTPSAAAAE